jgi:hypothetical protein
MTFAIKLAGACSDTSLPVLKRDQLLSGDNGGVRFHWDAAFPFSYAGGAGAGGAVVSDIAEIANGDIELTAGETMAYAGGGFDLSSMTTVAGATLANVRGPASVWSDIQADQRFLVACYLRLPTEANWNTNAIILPFFASSVGAGGGYGTVADPITMAFKNTSKTISFRRQTAIGTMVESTIIPTGHYGLMAQVAFWRTAAGVGASVRSAAGLTSAAATVGANNAADMSACRPRWGSVQPFTNRALAEHRASANYRVYRGFVENLARSGRDPVAVLAGDWSRMASRSAFS